MHDEYKTGTIMTAAVAAVEELTNLRDQVAALSADRDRLQKELDEAREKQDRYLRNVHYALTGEMYEGPAPLGVLTGAAMKIAADRERLIRALELIAAPDELVEANAEAFSVHACKRMKEQARAALKAQP
jgi:glutamate-1-semialdehyde aminotransferase